MSINGYDKTDERSVVNHARKLKGKTMEEVFLLVPFYRPTKAITQSKEKKKERNETIRQFVYAEERGDWHCSHDKRKNQGVKCHPKKPSDWYNKIINDKDRGEFLTKKEKKIILDKLQRRKCRKCHELPENEEYQNIDDKCKNKKCGEMSKKKEWKATKIQGNKGFVGNLIDCYFGYENKVLSGPDLPESGIEIKCCPLIGDSKKDSIKEPMSMNLIDYDEEVKYQGDVNKSSWFKKCRKTLLIFWKHRESTFIGKWKIEYVFLWKMDENLIKDVIGDYKNIVNRIDNPKGLRCTDEDGNDIQLPKDCKTEGNSPCKTGLHQASNTNLTTCPKHSSKPSFKKRRTKANSRSQPHGSEDAEKRAFRFKTAFVLNILEKYKEENPENGILVF